MKSIGLILFSCFSMLQCADSGKLTYLTKLPEKLGENSGIISLKDSTLWLIEDRGNTDEIYKVDFNGNLLSKFKVKNAKNYDWEDLAADEKGNVYIGDFGNNHNKRKNLVIYKLPNPELEKGEKIEAEKIEFNYPEQKDFPPVIAKLNFDAEAFFYRDSALYIITKNRTIPFTGEAFIYKIPAVVGTHSAQFIGKFTTCMNDIICQVTAADISPNGATAVLLGYGKLWVFTDFNGDDFSKGKMRTIDLRTNTQLESICFLNNKTLLVSDEERGGTGGNVYAFTLEK